MSNRDFGRRLIQVGMSRSLQVVFLLLGALFGGVGALLSWAQGQVDAGATTWTGPKSELVNTALGCFGIAAAVILIVATVAFASKPVAVHEHGIIVGRGRRAKATLYRDMRDIYRAYPLGQISFRRDENTPWTTISPRTSRFGKLVSVILEGQLQERGPALLKELRAGNAAEFWVLESGSERAASWAFGGRQSQRIGTPRLALGARGIHVNGKWYPIGETSTVQNRFLRESWVLSDGQGEIFSAFPAAVLSRDLFASLLEHVQAEARQATRN